MELPALIQQVSAGKLRGGFRVGGAGVVWLLAMGVAAAQNAPLTVTVAPRVTVCERPGITGAGWGVAYDLPGEPPGRRVVALIYPNHPDDWGKTTGTGYAFSDDLGRSWRAGDDNTPVAGMVDMWQDRLPDGELITLGIRSLPSREKQLREGASAPRGEYVVADGCGHCGTPCQGELARLAFDDPQGVIARPLPRIFPADDGGLLMPAYAWSRSGHRTLLLKSRDKGRHWEVASTIATVAGIRVAGANVTTPWLETAVARVADGTLLAVMRTGSNAQAPLVAARSADHGATWSEVELLVAGDQRRPVPGKLPGLCLMPNGLLVLLTAHSSNHCRLYFSGDGTGRHWNEGYVITSQSGGNASLLPVGDDRLLVFTPANGRINCWQVTASVNQTPEKLTASMRPASPRVVDNGPAVRLAWDAPADRANVAHYRIRPILLEVPPSREATEIYRYAEIATPDAATVLDLGKVLVLGGLYRFEVAAVDMAGRRSVPVSSAPIVVGNRSTAREP